MCFLKTSINSLCPLKVLYPIAINDIGTLMRAKFFNVILNCHPEFVFLPVSTISNPCPPTRIDDAKWL